MELENLDKKSDRSGQFYWMRGVQVFMFLQEDVLIADVNDSLLLSTFTADRMSTKNYNLHIFSQ